MIDGLQRLPKPVGVVILETHAAPFLLEWCKKLRLRVPQDVQIIGMDEKDHCLACEPHLTGLELPNERIGAVALETMLRHLRHEQPPPPSIIRVPGTTVINRGSTQLLPRSASRRPLPAHSSTCKHMLPKALPRPEW